MGWVGLAACAMWLVIALRGGGALARLRKLSELAPEPREPEGGWPLVTVIVPARDEAATIERAAKKLVALAYPNLQIVFVDDRSEDGTGEVLAEATRGIAHVDRLRVDALPEGWLGKVHALQVGLRGARGQWLLFVDADVELAEDVVERAIGLANQSGAGYLTLLPELKTSSVVVEGTVGAYLATIMSIMGPLGRDGRMAHAQNAGVGAFQLVQRRHLPEDGLAWLKMEVLDDVGLSLLMRKRGAQRYLLVAADRVGLRWYESGSALVSGLSKTAFVAFAQFSYLAGVATVALNLLLALGPFLALLHPWGAWGLLGYGICLGRLALALRHAIGLPLSRGLLTPAGLVVLSWALVRSMAHTARSGGVSWRGTAYPLDALRRGQRVRWSEIRRPDRQDDAQGVI